jgi:hypothetical protein
MPLPANFLQQSDEAGDERLGGAGRTALLVLLPRAIEKEQGKPVVVIA